ncbi:Putative HECT domain-containing protein [Septoria linicola]|uniref:HECT-type E3 ubiquitin transferase n=1 Tax=Septoria linicola TaxID=215465 RepID=A0A9Q9EGK7_9PEZI|nr:putative HECT domain-containing protein [Septoria linicola]USW48363.1 Putative HECT domain-containing protein [Septoria linicola]
MGRIKKVATERHTATLSPFVKDFVKQSTEVPLHQLPAQLDSFPQHWPLPRGDLYHWIPLLDRFDHLLELFNKEYALSEGPQTQPFERRILQKGDGEEGMPYPVKGAQVPELDATGYSEEGDRELVESVLHFTRLLHEHCGNRSLYASSTHINDLLHTTSLSLLQQCLRLGLRLAQRYQVARYKNHNPSHQAILLANHYNISLDNLHKIAMPFPKPYSATNSSVQTPGKAKEKAAATPPFIPTDLVSIAKDSIPTTVRKEISALTLSYYEPTPSTAASGSTSQPNDVMPVTPSPARRTSNLGPSRDRPSAGDRNISTDDVSATPNKSRDLELSSSTAPKLYTVSSTKIEQTPAWKLVKDSISDVPQEVRYELLNRIRVAKAFSADEPNAQEILEVRLLAIANLAYALSESKFQERVGIPDSEEPRRFHLAQQLSDLLQPAARGQQALTLQMETTVIMTLEALTKSRHKVGEVADALAISVNHGVLYYELRKVQSTLADEPSADKTVELAESKWRDAIFDLINSLLQSNTQARYGEKMLAAGIMGILVEALSLRTVRAECFYERILQFFDSFVHGISTAFQTLADVKGLDTIADLTAYQVNAALENAKAGNGLPAEYKSKVVDYDIPFYQQSTLRQVFKNTVHMFEHNTGGHDRLLRNLIDTPQVLGALRSVVENSAIFGANVWSGAVNIISSFIHNEPTSYQVIGEAGLSRSLLESITHEKLPEDLPPPGEIVAPPETDPIVADNDGQPRYPSITGILPVGEVLCDIPTAFGAICLNENGMQLFQASGALVKYFNIFLSPMHIRAMEEEGQTATTIGHSFDELARHHPRLKSKILAAVFNMLKRLKELTAILAHAHQSGAKLWESRDGKFVVAGGSAALTGNQAGFPGTTGSEGQAMLKEDDSGDERERAPTIPYLSACFKFLEGFFHNPAMCTLFCEESGAEILLDLAMSPSNPHDLVAFPLFSKLTQVLKTMCEVKAALVLPSIIKRTQHATASLQAFTSIDNRSSSFSGFLDLSQTTAATLPDGVNGTTTMKALLNAHMLTHILGRTLAPPPYTLRHGSQNNHLFSNLNFTDVYIELVDELSKLHAACTWEGLLMLRDMPAPTLSKTEPRAFHMRRIDGNGYVELADRADASRLALPATSLNPTEEGQSQGATLALKNSRAIRYLLSQVPMGIESFFHSLGQAIVTKRSEAIAIVWELDYRRNDPKEKIMETKYICQVLKMIGRMLLRNSYSMEAFGTKEALTLVMTKFYTVGGFEKLNSYLDRFVQQLVQQPDNEKVDASVKDAIAAILTFYGQVVRAKCINDASQSNSIIVRDRTQPDYFQPGHFLVEIRHAVLPAISKIWHSDQIEKFSKSNVETVVSILRMILKAEGEDRALKRSENASRRILAHRPAFKLRSTEHLSDLTGSGFDMDLSREALYRCGGHYAHAEAYCRLRQKDARVPRFPIPEADSKSNDSGPDQRTQSDAQTQTTGASAEAGGSDNAGDELSRGGLHTDALTVNADGSTRLVLSTDHDMASEDDFGSLGRIPDDMQIDDLASSIANPAAMDILQSLQGNALGLQGKDTQQPFVTIDDLNDERETLREDLIDQCLNVLSTQDGITFELADLIQAAVAKAGEGANPRADIGTTLVSSLMSLQGEESNAEAGKKIHAYAHLVALILQDRDFFDSTLDELKEYFASLVNWVQVGPDQRTEDAPWIEMILLIIERVLAEDEQPIEIEWIPPPVDDPLKPLPAITQPEPVVSIEMRAQLFDALEGLLPKIGKNRSLALSVCRVLVVLTRRRELAARLRAKQTLGKLFMMIRQLAGPVGDKLQASFLLILRHIVEDDQTIRQIMKAEIRVAFDNHRSSRAMDTSSYARHLYHLAIRDPQAFVEVTQEMLEILRFDGNPHRGQQLGLRKPVAAVSDAMEVGTNPTIGESTPAAPDSQKTAEAKVPQVDGSDGIVQFLLREISTYREVADPVSSKESHQEKSTEDSPADVEMADVAPAVANFALTSKAVDATNEKPPFKAEEHTIYIYRCFLLQCLAELVACYNRSKLEFINFSRKSDVPTGTPSKPRSGTLNYLLNVLLPVGTLEHRDDVVHRKKAATSNWAINVLVSLCTKTQEKQSSAVPSFDSVDFAEQEPELTYVRKFVLEHALRSFKDATVSSEPLDQRYSRLLSLGELFNRILNGKVDLQRSNVVAAGTFSAHQQIGRLMYEKNFVGALTSAIAELDFNFPNAKRAVKYILGPLKQLTELGVTISQSSDASSTGPGTSADEDEILSATSISDDDEGEREQTPDLLRNTTLGEDDEDSDDEEDDDDEGMEYEEYDEEMEYDEEEMPEHGDVVSDEDEDDLGGMGEIEGRPGDMDIDLDVMEEDEDDEDDSDDSDDESDDDEEDMDNADDVMFGDHMDLEEVTGDDENASLGDHDADDWDDEGLVLENDDIVVDGGSPHGGPLEHIGHVLGADDPSEPGDHDHIVRIDMGEGEEEFFEDEMPPEEDDDEDEGDYGEDIVYEPEIEDGDDDEEADGGFAWDIQPPAAVLRGAPHHHHHHAHLHRGGFHEMLGMINDPLRPMGMRSHRSTPNAREEEGINPLLQRDGGGQRERDALELANSRLAARSRTLLPRVGPEAILQDLVATVGPNIGGHGIINVNMDPGALQGIGGLPPNFTLHTRGPHAMIDIDPSRPLREQLGQAPDGRRWTDMLTGGARAPDRSSHEEAQAIEFRPSSTANRWQEEARMLFPGKFHEKALRIINMLLRALVPTAMEAKRVRDKEDAERRAAAEKAAEEARKKAEAEKAEKEAQEKREREEREAQERAEQEAQAREQAAAAEEAASSGNMEGVESATEASADASEPSNEATQTGERVTITIRGRELDITTLGIDREYIEALPEDMREEVIMAQFAEQRSQAVQSGEPQSEISQEFLEALPREIQQELLRQEQMERRRRDRDEERRRRAQEGGQPAAAPAQPEEMNNADFMAMLDPGLRQAVLADADDTVLAALPDELQAEARALFGDRRPRGEASGRLGRAIEGAAVRVLNGQGLPVQTDDAAREPSRPRRPVAQMLDKAGIATLLRLMFVSLNHKAKSNLHGILSDVCKNTQNRAEVISILLSILQDVTADVNAVERSFAQLSLRAKQTAGPKTPQTLKRSLTGQQTMMPSTDLSPLNIVQQCLGTLNALANDNPRVPSFFLNEHETITSQKVTPAKKGKGRENKAGRFPLNALLTLLDRKLITENTAVMETLASLLGHVTHPLTILLKRAKEAIHTSSTCDSTAGVPEGQQSAVTSTPDVPMQEVSVTESSTEQPAEQVKAAADAELKKKHRDLVPPEVPEENIGLVVNILAARECPSKTFSDTLDIIKNLSSIPGSKEIFGKELIRQAQELGQALLVDLEQLATQINAAETGPELQGMALASFSSAGSKQKKLLRVLVALDHLFDPKRTPQSPAVPDAGMEQRMKDDILATLHQSSTFEKLWDSLSTCLAAIRQRGNMVNIATILLPLIESLMVMCRNNALKEATAAVATPTDATARSTPPPNARMENLFFSFTEEHRKILNELIRNNPKLMNGNLAVLAKNSKVLEFDNKRAYFSRKLHDRRAEARVSHPSLQLNVRRDQVFLDSFKSLYYKTGNEIKYGKLNIRFHGEEGIDAGGVSREWFAAMARQMFNPDYALFNPVAADRTTFHPNTLSDVNAEHLLFFKFIGRIIGKALYENRVLDCHFSRAVYRKILGKSVSLKDMETLDLDYYKSLVWILENDITDVTFETFSVDVDSFGVTQTIDLIENGREIPVTEENKHEYVRHVVEYRLIKSVEKQLDNFLAGFHEIIPAELVSIFNEQELELLISGLPDIDVEDWKNNTEYTNYTSTSPQVLWFWRAIRSFDKEEKAKVLQFVTGTSKVPLNGFKELEGMNGFSRFNIHRDYSSKEKLPSSHTCFNQLDLPEYDSYEHLRHQLYTAITAGSEYFGFA